MTLVYFYHLAESFKVLIKEMQALALDVKVLSEDNKEIEMRDSSDYDDDIRSVEEVMDAETRRESDEEILNSGFTEESDLNDEISMLGGEVEIDE